MQAATSQARTLPLTVAGGLGEYYSLCSENFQQSFAVQRNYEVLLLSHRFLEFHELLDCGKSKLASSEAAIPRVLTCAAGKGLLSWRIRNDYNFAMPPSPAVS